MKSLFLDFGDRSKYESNTIDNIESSLTEHVNEKAGDTNFTTQVVNSPTTPSTLMSRCTRKRPRSPLMMCDLITVMGEMASIVKNPTYWTGTLYARVMIVDRFDE